MANEREPSLETYDTEIAELINAEDQRQRDSVRLIASENYVSRAVLEATACSLTNKYAEGYAGRRYYEGMDFIDPLERLAIDRAKQLFGAEHANVQPYSGSPANLAVLLASCKPGDTIMGLSLPAGGHLTHGWRVSATGIYYNAVQYGVRESDHRIDMDEVRSMAKEHKPKLIWVGHSAYPRQLDFAAFAEIAKEVGAVLAADIAHIAGLVAGKQHPDPMPHCDIVSTTTHKTLRGPRGGLIMCKEPFAKAIDKAVFPGLQGGPHNHSTAAKAVAFKEAMSPEFRTYAKNVVDNGKALAEAMLEKGFTLITGGTDNHLLLVDLTNKDIAGRKAARALNDCGIELNSNSIPFDPRKPFDPSGIRVGVPSVTSRGMGTSEMASIASLIDEVVTEAAKSDDGLDPAFCETMKGKARELLAPFPAPGL
jgi:glycine hydroxymethyltransferase